MSTTIVDHSYRLPPADMKDSDSWQFLGFVMHFHTQQCSCGARHSWSETLRLFGHRTYVASRGHRLLPFTGNTVGLPPGEPLAIYSLPDEPVLVCHSCIGGYRKAGEEVIELRAARDEQNWVNALLTDAARERALRARAASQPSKPQTPAASVDDIMNIGA